MPKRTTTINDLPRNTALPPKLPVLPQHVDYNAQSLEQVINAIEQGVFASGGVLKATTSFSINGVTVSVGDDPHVGVTNELHVLSVRNADLNVASLGHNQYGLVVIQAIADTQNVVFTDRDTGAQITHQMTKQLGKLELIKDTVNWPNQASILPACPDDCVPVAGIRNVDPTGLNPNIGFIGSAYAPGGSAVSNEPNSRLPDKIARELVDTLAARVAGQADSITNLTQQINALNQVNSVTIQTSSPMVRVNETRQLFAIAKDAQGNVISTNAPIWESGDPSRATVNSSGVVTGVAVGTVTIQVRIGTQTATLNLTVESTASTPNYLAAVYLASMSNSRSSAQFLEPGQGANESTTQWRMLDTTSATWGADISEQPLPADRAFLLKLYHANALTGDSFDLQLRLKNSQNENHYLEKTVTVTNTPADIVLDKALQNPQWEQYLFGTIEGPPQNKKLFAGRSADDMMPFTLEPSDYALEQTPSGGTASVAVAGTVNLSVQAVQYIVGVRTLITRAVTWTSLNTGVATVNSSGAVTGVAAGIALIKAESAEVVALFQVTVTSGSENAFDLTMSGNTLLLVDFSLTPAPPTTDLSQYQSNNIINPHRLYTDDMTVVDGAEIAPIYAGVRIIRSRVQKSRAANYANNWGLNMRAEAYCYITCQHLRRYRFRWWFGLAGSWQPMSPAVRHLVGQVHGVANVGSPPWSIILEGNTLKAQLRSSALAGYGGNLYGAAHLATPGTEDEWTLITDVQAMFAGKLIQMDVVWRPDFNQTNSVGEFIVDVNKVNRLNRTNVPSAFNESSAGYPKSLGQYFWLPYDVAASNAPESINVYYTKLKITEEVI